MISVFRVMVWMAVWGTGLAAAQPFSDREVERAFQQLTHADPEVRATSQRALDALRNAEGVSRVIELLAHRDHQVRDEVVGFLVELGSRAVPGLVRAMSHRLPGVRAGAAEALGLIADPVALPAVLKGIADRDAGVVRASARAAGEFKDARAIPALKTLAKHPDPKTRLAVVIALGQCGPSAVPVLIPLLADPVHEVWTQVTFQLEALEGWRPAVVEALKDPVPLVRQRALALLGRKKFDDLMPRYGELLRTDPDAQVVKQAMWALDQFKDASLIPILVTALDHPDQVVRVWVGYALSSMGAPAVEALHHVVRKGTSRSKVAALEAVARHGSAGLPALEEGLRDPLPEVRVAACAGLAKFPQDAFLRLDAILQDPHPLVRIQAQETLRLSSMLMLTGLPAAVDPSNTAGLVQLTQTLDRIKQQTLKWVIRGVKDPDAKVRVMACHFLPHFGAEALEGITLAAVDPEYAVRVWGGALVYHIGADHIQPYIDRMLKDPDHHIRGQVNLMAHYLKEERLWAYVKQLAADDPSDFLKSYSYKQLADHYPDQRFEWYALALSREWSRTVQVGIFAELRKYDVPKSADLLMEAFGKSNVHGWAEMHRHQALMGLASLSLEGPSRLVKLWPTLSVTEKVDVVDAVGPHATPGVFDVMWLALMDASPQVVGKGVYWLTRLGERRDERMEEGRRHARPEVRGGVLMAMVNTQQPHWTRQILEGLKDADPRVRGTALQGVGTLKLTATAAVIAALGDADARVRAQAAWAMGQLKEPGMGEALWKGVKDRDPGVREEVAKALRKFPSAGSARAAAAALPDASPRVTAALVSVLGEVAEPTALPILLTLAASDSREVRLEVLRALQRAGDPRGLPVLRQALRDPEPRVREQALVSIQAFRDGEVFDDVIALLGDASLMVRRSAMEAMIERMGPGVMPQVILGLEHPSAGVRAGLLEAVMDYPDEALILAVVKRLDDEEDEVASAAAAVLSRYGLEAVPAVVEAMRHPHPRVRRRVAEVSVRWDDGRIVKGLESLKGDADPSVRRAAQRSLDQLAPGGKFFSPFPAGR